MSNPLIHFPLYIGDALKKFTDFPTLEERGAWLSIVVALIQNDGVLPNDKTLYYKCMIFEEKDKQVIKQVISKCLIKTQKGYECPEINSLIAKQKELRDKRSQAGRIGGKKSPKSKQVLKQVLNHVIKQSESESESDIELESESESESELLKNIYVNFEEFWKSYLSYEVSKGSKKEAKEKFIKILKKGVSYEEIKQGLTKYMQYCHDNKVKTKQVFRWLAKEGWSDEYPEQQATIYNQPNREQNKNSPAIDNMLVAFAEAAAE